MRKTYCRKHQSESFRRLLLLLTQKLTDEKTSHLQKQASARDATTERVA